MDASQSWGCVMEGKTVNQGDVANQDGGMAATLYVAIELSRSGWLVAVLGPGAQRPSRHKLAAGDVDGLLALIARTRGTATRVCSCYEAGYEGFWLHRRLVAAGLESHIVDP